jgi:hypothetical protein
VFDQVEEQRSRLLDHSARGKHGLMVGRLWAAESPKGRTGPPSSSKRGAAKALRQSQLARQ